MRQHIAIAIAALMITSMAFAISTTSVSATHATPTISISPDFVKEGESYVFTLSVTNEGGDPINTVEITQPSYLKDIESIVKLPKDNIVENANVTLTDGTQVTVISASVTVAENTVVSLPKGTLIKAPSGDNAELYEDGTAEMMASENSIATVSAVKAAADRLVALQSATDHGWDWNVTGLTAHSGNPSGINLYGVTALGLLDAYELTGNQGYLDAAKKTGDNRVASDPHTTYFYSQDIEFLARLGEITENSTYTDKADNVFLYFRDENNRYCENGCSAASLAAFYQNFFPSDAGFVEWQLASWVRAADATGYHTWADEMRDEMLDDISGGSPYFDIADNTEICYVIGLAGIISATENAEAVQRLIDFQQSDGSWVDPEGRVQNTAYAVMALVAVGEGDVARLGACWLIDNQLANGGWLEPDSKEYSEIDSEAVQALVAQAPEPVPVTVEEQEVTLSKNDLRLLADTLAAASFWLPEDTPAEVPSDVDTNVAGDMTLVTDDTVTLPDDSAADVRLLANTLILYTSGSAKGIVAPLVAGSEVDLRGSEDVVLPAGTTVTGEALVTVAENEDITIPADTTVVLAAGTVPENVPEDWSFSSDAWSSTEDNIAVGETVEFPFAATVDGGSSWNITVKTTDVKDYEALVVITMTSDGEAPSVTATVSPDPTNSSVTITVKASEKLSKLGKVTVKQKGAADENVFEITMASANGITWTGTYAVIPDHDGAAVVSIENSTDLVGNAGGENASVATFEVDTIAPDAPKVGTADLNELPAFTNQPNQLVYGTAIDVAEVLVRVNADVITTTPRTDNGYSVAITLVEGFNEVGVSFVDEAGNASEENVQDVFVDSVAPTVDMVSIAGKVYEKDMPINDNTPTIVVEALDPGYPDTGSGIPSDNLKVTLVEKSVDLENATPWENSGLFENTYSAGLSDNTYTITVTASDKFGHTKTDNFTFVVDTVAPDPPETPFLSELPTELVDERDHIIRGYAENDSTIKVYAASTLTLIDQGTADSSGYYRFTVTLPKGTHDIYVSATDAAGNESDKVLYGTVTVTITPVPPVDTVAPVVSITAPEAEATTDEASIVIVGKVSELAEWTVSAPSGIQSGTTDSAGNFSASIALVDGTNTIIVTAVDAAGNPSAPVSIEVTRTVVPLETYAIVLVILLVVLVAIAVLKR